MRILFTIAGLHPASGGPSRSVPALCAALAANGAEVELLSHHYGSRDGEPLFPRHENLHATFVDCSSFLARRLQWTPRFAARLGERLEVFRPQILHDTGVWLSTNHAVARSARGRRLPRIVSPRGMLSAWSLRHRGVKKAIAWSLYQRRDLETADVLHATAEAEAEEFRRLGLRQPIAVIANGIELPPDSDPQPRVDPRRTALFLSRIHPKKGLADLVRAWAEVRPPGWRVLIAGNDEQNHRAEIEQLIRQRGLGSDFTFVGTVDEQSRWICYRSADLFVLPSRSENFGLVIAEALACGLPVITTRGTPWEALRAQHCGWWTDIGVAPLAAVLREATALPVAELRAMGSRGRALVEGQFAWPQVAAQMLDVYRWMTGHGQKPSCVWLSEGDKANTY